MPGSDFRGRLAMFIEMPADNASPAARRLPRRPALDSLNVFPWGCSPVFRFLGWFNSGFRCHGDSLSRKVTRKDSRFQPTLDTVPREPPHTHDIRNPPLKGGIPSVCAVVILSTRNGRGFRVDSEWFRVVPSGFRR